MKPREIHYCRYCRSRYWNHLLPDGQWFQETGHPVPPDLPADGRGVCDECMANVEQPALH